MALVKNLVLFVWIVLGLMTSIILSRIVDAESVELSYLVPFLWAMPLVIYALRLNPNK